MGIRHAGKFYMYIVHSSGLYHLTVKLKGFMAKSGHARNEKNQTIYHGDQST